MSKVLCLHRMRIKPGLGRLIGLVNLSGIILLSACATTTQPPTQEQNQGSKYSEPRWILNGATIIEDEWEHMRIVKETEYRVVAMDGRVAIRARGKNSASSLLRYVEINPHECPIIEWSWRIDKLQQDADIKIKDKEDVAASIYVIFGDPGIVGNLKPVPTLRYVWASHRNPVGSIIQSPYVDTINSIVIESGDAKRGQWVSERRNVLEDYKRAFGKLPSEPVQVVMFFTDNDQTQQHVEAYYEWIRMKCSS